MVLDNVKGFSFKCSLDCMAFCAKVTIGEWILFPWGGIKYIIVNNKLNIEFLIL
jgi:hypothetical protein